MNKPIWYGDTVCDICNKPCGPELYDARTIAGPWATLCPKCFKLHTNHKLGLGCGQRYVLDANNNYVEVEGGF